MVEINNTTKQPINLVKTKKIVEEFLRVYKKTKFEVSIAVVGAKRIQNLNNDYRGINKTTDVLSFPSEGESLGEPRKNYIEKHYLGEVVINIEETKKADKYLEIMGAKKSADYIFYFLLVHGLLHLVGYEDETDKKRLEMIDIGKKFLDNML